MLTTGLKYPGRRGGTSAYTDGLGSCSLSKLVRSIEADFIGPSINTNREWLTLDPHPPRFGGPVLRSWRMNDLESQRLRPSVLLFCIMFSRLNPPKPLPFELSQLLFASLAG